MKEDLKEILKIGQNKNSIEKQYFSMVKPMHSKFIEPYKKFSNLLFPITKK